MPGIDSLLGKIPPQTTINREMASQSGIARARGVYRAIVIAIYAQGTDYYPPNTIIAWIPDLDYDLDVATSVVANRMFLPQDSTAIVCYLDEVEVTLNDNGTHTYRVVEQQSGWRIPRTDDLDKFARKIQELTAGSVQDGAILESVPEFRRRVGDRVTEGLNNAIIVVSRDRADAVDTGYKANAGTITSIAGRVSADMNPREDAATSIVSQRTDIDSRLDIDLVRSAPDKDATDDEKAAIEVDDVYAAAESAVGLRATDLRLSGRQSIKLQTDRVDRTEEDNEELPEKQGTIVITPTGEILLDNKSIQIDLSTTRDELRIVHKTARVYLTIDRESNIVLENRGSEPKTKLTISNEGIVTLEGFEEINFGKDANKHFVTFEELKALFERHTHNTSYGPTSTAGDAGHKFQPSDSTETTSPRMKIYRG